MLLLLLLYVVGVVDFVLYKFLLFIVFITHAVQKYLISKLSFLLFAVDVNIFAVALVMSNCC